MISKSDQQQKFFLADHLTYKYIKRKHKTHLSLQKHRLHTKLNSLGKMRTSVALCTLLFSSASAFVPTALFGAPRSATAISVGDVGTINTMVDLDSAKVVNNEVS